MRKIRGTNKNKCSVEANPSYLLTMLYNGGNKLAFRSLPIRDTNPMCKDSNFVILNGFF